MLDALYRSTESSDVHFFFGNMECVDQKYEVRSSRTNCDFRKKRKPPALQQRVPFSSNIVGVLTRHFASMAAYAPTLPSDRKEVFSDRLVA